MFIGSLITSIVDMRITDSDGSRDAIYLLGCMMC